MASTAPSIAAPKPSPARRLATFLHPHPRLQLAGLLSLPVGWLVGAYIGSLAVLFIAAFWRLDTFTAEVVHDLGFSNFEMLWKSDVYRTIVGRTLGMGLAVTP